jgi:hypothetical protein
MKEKHQTFGFWSRKGTGEVYLGPFCIENRWHGLKHGFKRSGSVGETMAEALSVLERTNVRIGEIGIREEAWEIWMFERVVMLEVGSRT